MSKNRAVLLVPYYGQFNNYFPIWLQTAGYNNDFDFVFISDLQPDVNLPENVRFFKKSFAELKSDLQDCLEFEINLENYYRLTEFRPVLGKVYQQYITDYEFWGYCDTDTVLGKISDFITTKVMDEYDAILSHGHFILLRNSASLNDMYMFEFPGYNSYKNVYRSALSCNFDEWGGLSFFLKHNRVKMYDEVVFADLFYQHYDFRLAQGGDVGEGRIYAWKNGVLTEYSAVGSEVVKAEKMYVHLQKRNMVWNGEKSDQYIIVPNEFITDDRLITAKFIMEHSKKKIIYWSYIKRRIKYLMRKAWIVAGEKLYKKGLCGKYD